MFHANAGENLVRFSQLVLEVERLPLRHYYRLFFEVLLFHLLHLFVTLRDHESHFFIQYLRLRVRQSWIVGIEFVSVFLQGHFGRNERPRQGGRMQSKFAARPSKDSDLLQTGFARHQTGRYHFRRVA
jgi:hypothetical protein